VQHIVQLPASSVAQELHRAGIPPERALPAWVAHTARSRWGTELSWETLRTLSTTEAADALQSQAVTEDHAAKVRSVIRSVLEVRKEVPHVTIEEVVVRYLTKVVQRPSVHRSSTVMWHWKVLQGLWPGLRRSSRLLALMRGVCVMNPLAPERAGVNVERKFNLQAVVEAGDALLQCPTRTNRLVVQAVANIIAGARQTETIRDMLRHCNTWTQGQEAVEDGNVMLWISQGFPKDDLVGLQAHLRPKPVVVPKGWLLAGPDHVQLERGEEKLVVRMVGELIRGAGGVGSVTVARRAAAADARRIAADTGLTDAESLAAVRDVLGHKPDSASTWRYVPERLGARAKEVLTKVATGRSVAGR